MSILVSFLGFIQQNFSSGCERNRKSHHLNTALPGHNAVTCLMACRHNEDCMFASYSSKSGCQLSDTCSPLNDLYEYRFKKIGKKYNVKK